ncbi:MAG: hypothetical protein VYC34_12525 [Planctomycetota bacterium]|nr:hypothetical protein [Planctomycetota bacterium]
MPTSLRLALLTLLLSAVLGSIAAPLAAAQDAEAPASAAATEQADADLVRRVVADRLARLSIMFIRQLNDPTPEEYRIAALVLEEALTLAPGDEDLVRRLIEAWHAQGEHEKVLEYTRQLLKINPNDTLAQLRLISARIRGMQTAELRMTAYERMLSDDGAGLDASVRSRLALDGALLAREMGNEDRFLDWLALALELDMTNKEAAVLTANYTLERVRDPLTRVEILTNVILSDPLDPSTHLNLARELMSNGAYAAADRF